MIRRYRFGNPIPTQSAVLQLPLSPGCPEEFTLTDGAFCRALDRDDALYGLGENVRGLNKRGWRYVSNCSDEPHHTEDKSSLYGAHNFFLLQGGGGECFGVFFDFGGRIEFDLGYTRPDRLAVTPDTLDLEAYLITGESPAAIVKELRTLTGRSYIPPKWAFGVGQSRWGYKCREDIRAVEEGYRQNGLPLEYICLDIDYMDGYADFTVDRTRYPDLSGFAAEMKARGVRLVPIIDAGVKILPGDETYESGKAGGYFVKDRDGTDFVGAVWPGLTHFADVLDPAARAWFGSRYQALTDLGIEGFWNDMNEPALFYTPRGLDAMLEGLRGVDGASLGADFFPMLESVYSLGGNAQDYRAMRHRVDGRSVPHERVHNLYGGNMTRAASEALDKLLPDQRTLLFSRSSFIGAHRYGGIWFGDNCSWWQHILLSFQLLASAGMCGFLFCGSDIGGFACDATEDLVLRWTEMSLFAPLMRNHSADGTRPQEPYRFTDKAAFRRILGLRYSLLPYLYSEYMKAALSGGMLFRPLSFDYPGDPMAREVQDQLMFGDEIMLAPVYTQNSRGRSVYLPQPMRAFIFRDGEHYKTELLSAGWHYVAVELDETAVFLKPGRLLPLANSALNTSSLDEARLTLLRYEEGDGAQYRMYSDDGLTRDYDDPAHWRTIAPEEAR